MITNLLGEKILISNGESKEGMNVADLNVAELTKGIYLITLESENNIWQTKFTVQ